MPPKKTFPIVGIGASAGGLEILTMNMVDIALPKSKDAARALIARLQEQEVDFLVADRLKKNGEVVASG